MDIRKDVLERFLRYVKIDTQSQDGVEDRYPSTEKQLVLSRLLVDELRTLGIEDAGLDEHGYVMATLPQNVPEGVAAAADIPTVGLLAHVDTYHEVPGKDVRPILHENYKGGPLELPGAPDKTITPEDNPDLRKHEGDTIVTSDGSTLLGADDKAGIAEVLEALRKIGVDAKPIFITGFTDASIYNNEGIEIAVVGIGAQNEHSKDECIAIEDMEKALTALVEILSLSALQAD